MDKELIKKQSFFCLTGRKSAERLNEYITFETEWWTGVNLTDTFLFAGGKNH